VWAALKDGSTEERVQYKARLHLYREEMLEAWKELTTKSDGEPEQHGTGNPTPWRKRKWSFTAYTMGQDELYFRCYCTATAITKLAMLGFIRNKVCRAGLMTRGG